MASAGSKSVISNDMQELGQGREDVSNKIQGHKANLSNPNTSEESKENSRAAIESLGGDANLMGNDDSNKSKNAADKLDGTRAAQ